MRHKNAQRGDAMIIVFILLIAAAVVAVGLWHFHKPIKHPVATVGACSHLALSQGTSDGTAGTIYKHAVVTNTGSVSCTITGYPTVYMTDAGGTILGSGAAANPLYPVSTITVAPGGKAHSVVAYPEQANFNPGTCSAQGSQMKMYVPGVVAPLFTAWSDYSCPGFSASTFQTGA